jgi:hypothetical protein
MSGAGYASNVHTNFAIEIEPQDGARRWRVMVLGTIRIYREVRVLDTSAHEAALELTGYWPGKHTPLEIRRR